MLGEFGLLGSDGCRGIWEHGIDRRGVKTGESLGRGGRGGAGHGVSGTIDAELVHGIVEAVGHGVWNKLLTEHDINGDICAYLCQSWQETGLQTSDGSFPSVEGPG